MRLVLLTEQTRDWEHGREDSVLRGVRRYSVAAAGVAAVALPIFLVAMPWLVRVVFGSEYLPAVDAARIVLVSAAILLVLGWSKSLPVTIGRPRLRIVTHGLETLVLLPLVVVLGARWDVTGAAVAILVSTCVFAVAWAVVLVRLRDELRARGRASGHRRPPDREGRRRLRGSGRPTSAARRAMHPRSRRRCASAVTRSRS